MNNEALLAPFFMLIRLLHCPVVIFVDAFAEINFNIEIKNSRWKFLLNNFIILYSIILSIY